MNKPLSLYIHIPFCEHICNYCDFPKLQYFSTFSKKYLKKLKEEIDSFNISHQLDTIYIGGGTPTALSDEEFEDLLSYLDKYCLGVKEYTIEANPESLSLNKIKMMKNHHVNRVSIGVESTIDKYLLMMNRHHHYDDVKKAIDLLFDNRIDNINVDLILGMPGYDLSSLKIDLDNLSSLNIKHISCYSLTVSPHTGFYINNIKPQEDDQMREYYDFVHYYLLDKGFIHYEVSNWAKPGYESRHNLTYWKDERYYGAGLGASGYIDNIRYTNTKSINAYIKGENIRNEEIVGLNDDRTYYILTNMRTIYGINLIDYQKRFNSSLLEEKSREISELYGQGLININQEGISPSYEGMMLLDQIILKLL